MSVRLSHERITKIGDRVATVCELAVVGIVFAAAAFFVVIAAITLVLLAAQLLSEVAI